MEETPALRAEKQQVTEEREATSTGAVPWRVLRTSSILAGVPYHRLSKGGSIDIRLVSKDASGHRVDVKWEVSGQAGPLAYKAHTLLVEQRIDELRQQGKLTRLVPLGGGWREAARALDLGGDTVSAKKAVLETAKLDITAEIRYLNKEGKEEYVKAYNFHPYTILERGSTHEGKTLEQIYFLLHDLIYTIERDGTARPLNYDYLKALPPAASRFYKLMSSKIYGAIKGRREETMVIYSELCECLPLKRTNSWQRAQAQLKRVHKPHLDSGYLKRVRYERIRDGKNEPDLEIYYTPGARAIEEYEFFNGRRAKLPAPMPSHAKEPVAAIDETLLGELTKRGIGERKGREILGAAADQDVMGQLEYTDHLIRQAPPEKFHNPAGLYITRLSERAPIPDAFETSARKKDREERDRRAAERLALETLYRTWRREQEVAAWSALTSEDQEKLVTEARDELVAKAGERGVELWSEASMRHQAEQRARSRLSKELPTFEEWQERGVAA